MSILEVFSPFNGDKVGEVPISTREEVEKYINIAYSNYEDYSKRLDKHRIIEILNKSANIIESRLDELAVLSASEGGKPLIDSKVEIARAANGIKVAISELEHLEGKEIAMGHTASSKNRIAYTLKEPIGVVASISAFNHPFNLAVHQVIPAVAVGCPVIIRPAGSTPLSAFKLVEILEEAGLPKGYATALASGIPEASFLASHKKIGFLSFIGSAKVGWHLSKNVADGTRFCLEHGGVAPAIIEEDADIEKLLQPIVKAAFYHAGQVCVSTQRVYVNAKIAREVAEKIAALAKKLKVGNQLDITTEVGPLIDKKEIDRVDSWVKDAISSGAELLCGGQKVGESCYAPTVLFNPSDEAIISKNEIFGPVVCIYPYNDLDEAIKRANSLDVSFQASIFTSNIDKAFKAIKRLNATAVLVNETTAFRVDWMPFGGAKTSGFGLGGIGYSMEEMCNKKMFVIKSDFI